MGGPGSGRRRSNTHRVSSRTSMMQGKPYVNPFYKATAMKSLTNRVRKLETAETHKFKTFNNETVVGGTVFATIPLFKTINNVSEGTGNDNFVGSSIHQTGIALKYFIHNVSGICTYWRMAIVVCKNGNELSSAGEEIFLDDQDQGFNFSSSNDRQQLMLNLNRNKYTVIYDKIHKIGAKNTSATENFKSNKMINFYKSYAGKKIMFDSSANPNERMYLLGWPIDSNLDGNNLSLEISGQTTYYFKDY